MADDDDVDVKLLLTVAMTDMSAMLIVMMVNAFEFSMR